MTNFEIITQRPSTLEEFLEMVVDDALAAKGCSYDLTMPDEEWAGRSWRDWLEQEAAEDGAACQTSRGTMYSIGMGGGLFRG